MCIKESKKITLSYCHRTLQIERVPQKKVWSSFLTGALVQIPHNGFLFSEIISLWEPSVHINLHVKITWSPQGSICLLQFASQMSRMSNNDCMFNPMTVHIMYLIYTVNMPPSPPSLSFIQLEDSCHSRDSWEELHPYIVVYLLFDLSINLQAMFSVVCWGC